MCVVTTSNDDAKGFYDRSLGTINNGATKAYQLTTANNTALGAGADTINRTGSLATTYDNSGNLTKLEVTRNGKCAGAASGTCSQSFFYSWDEVGRLVRARRWDQASVPANPVTTAPAVDLQYHYAAGDSRVLKTARAPNTPEVHTAYIFPGLELRRAQFNVATAGDYTLDSATEVAYLFANGVRLARLVHQPVTSAGDGVLLRVFFELGDHLGSGSVALDKASGELVERSTYQAYGGAESSYRPSKWGDFREDYRFTGKEEDVEVGLTYFGKRFYNAALQRWVSPDPLEVHQPGQADANLYAYVSGAALKNVDPLGLQDEEAAAPEFTSMADDVQVNEALDEAFDPCIDGGCVKVDPSPQSLPPPRALAVPSQVEATDCHGSCQLNPTNPEAKEGLKHFAIGMAGTAIGTGCAIAGAGTGCLLVASGMWTSQATGSPDAPEDAKGSSEEAAFYGGVLEGSSLPTPNPTLTGRLRLSAGGDPAIRNAANIPPLEGHFDVVGHGLPNAIIDETDQLLTATELAARVRATPSWEGQKVRLLSCSTGACQNGFAQQLANDLGVDVLAPTADFAVSRRGNVSFPEGGRFAPFAPQEVPK